MTVVPQPDTDTFVFLNGRPPVNEYLGFVIQSNGGATLDRRGLMDEWRAANAHVHELEAAEAGVADGPTLLQPPDSAAAIIQQALDDPSFKRTALLRSYVAIVDTDSLVVYQKQINLRYAAQLRQTLGANPSDDEILKFALNLDQAQPPITMVRVAQNAFQFRSPSMDLRQLEVALLPQIAGFIAGGRLSGAVVLPFGFGTNLLSAIHIGGRLVLHNGSHRAYVLRELGINPIPVVVFEAATRDELPAITDALELLQNPDRYLIDPRPPLLKDYFDPALRKQVDVKRRERQITVQFGTSILDA